MSSIKGTQSPKTIFTPDVISRLSMFYKERRG